jgi:hypothetical protein
MEPVFILFTRPSLGGLKGLTAAVFNGEGFAKSNAARKIICKDRY